MISQQNISPATPMGATLVAGGGATFRTWAPRASAVYLNGSSPAHNSPDKLIACSSPKTPTVIGPDLCKMPRKATCIISG